MKLHLAPETADLAAVSVSGRLPEEVRDGGAGVNEADTAAAASRSGGLLGALGFKANTNVSAGSS